MYFQQDYCPVIMLFLKTILISTIIGTVLGTTTGLTARYLSPLETKTPQVQNPKIILASEQTSCCNKSALDTPVVGHEIIAAQIINGEEKKVSDETPSPSPTTAPTQVPIVQINKTQEVPTPSATIVPETEGNLAPIDENNSEKSGLDPKLIFQLVNDYRKKLGLDEFQEDDNVCSLANERKTELPGEFASGKLHSGLYNRNLPYWITENVILMRTELQALSWWLHSPIHRRSIEGAYKYSCVACLDDKCSELFTSFTPKQASTE